jgi:hypothetical protein
VLWFWITIQTQSNFCILIGLAGSALLILNGAIHHQNKIITMLVLIASICYAVNVNLIKTPA